MATDNLDQLLTVRDVMALLRINRATAYRWNATGALPAVRLPGDTLRWRKSDLERLMREGMAQAAGGAPA